MRAISDLTDLRLYLVSIVFLGMLGDGLGAGMH